ncbi:ATP-binding protein [Ancylomarina euxinus]|uniref:ATP-binding protein n=1 Tax=Ancylomarina euxinus TaxID=2283627 RepID=A0A425Y1Z1_9BACT|nr:ATP-binding protein [Ancylomarina euxinus]MCZ4695013.1 AAA family ATPase [Ancylomarina euxinus]MUP15051.1 AAA family ATPase [Ancylomarina euxinus]RRG21937.1 ATP-binding protein [Ancylomarina euxinus]
MLASFSVQNFRSVKDKVTLSFEAAKSDDLEDYYILEPKKGVRLLKLGLIYGANASGKTNLLKALDFLRDLILEPVDKKTETINVSPFLFSSKTPNENTILSIEFFQEGIKYLYDLEVNKNTVVSEELRFYNPNKALVFKRITDVEKQLTIINFGGKIDINKSHKLTLEANTLWNNTVLGGFLKTNIESTELQNVINWFRSKLKPIVHPKSNLFDYVSNKLDSNVIDKRTILEVLKKADFNISDIVVDVNEQEVTPEFVDLVSKRLMISDSELNKLKLEKKITTKELLFEHVVNGTDKYHLSFDDESAGTQRYYEFGGLLDMLINNEIIFPIDEFESSLHPDLLKHFLLSFLTNSKKSQLIATTHLRELLMEKNIFRNDAIWFTEKIEDGSTDLFSLDDFDSSVIRDTSSVYNAYKVGKLGATPNLSDYYLDIEDDETEK